MKAHTALFVMRSFLIASAILFGPGAKLCADANGKTGATATGCTCHSNNPGTATTVAVTSSTGSFTVAPQSVTTFTITVSHASLTYAGVDLAVRTTATGSTSAGTLAPASGSGLRLGSSELTHTTPKAMSGGSASFSFTWTAPSTPGTYYMRAAGNAVNHNNNESGDVWNYLPSRPITVAGALVTSPNTAVTWCAGSTHAITRTSGGFTSANIDLSADGGATYTTSLATGISASLGTWNWTIPASISAGTQYRIRISDAAGVAASDESNVNFAITALPDISGHPSDVTVCSGGQAAFTVTSAGTGSTYQWRKGGVNIAGATAASYSINPVTAASAGSYDVVLTNGCGSTTSNAATLTVNLPPSVTTHPSSAGRCGGDTVSFTVVASGGGLTYQWRRNTVNVNGATAATLALSNLTAGDTGSYDVVVSGTCSPPVTSSAALLSISAPPQVLTQPKSAEVCGGKPVTLSVTASGGNLRYQWRKKGSPVSGATGSTYGIAALTPADTGSYDVVISGDCSPSVTSAVAIVSIYESPAVTTSPAGQTVKAGQDVTLQVGATGRNLRYQWRKNSVDRTGDTLATLVLKNVQFGDAGTYTCRVRNLCDSVTSQAAQLTVTPSGDGPFLFVSASLIDFGAVRPGAQRDSAITGLLKNIGAAPLNVTGISISGADSADFSVTQGGGVPFTLSPDESRTVTLRFTAPGIPGLRNASLDFASNSTVNPSVKLSGEAAQPALTASLELGTVKIGSVMDTTMRVCNTGKIGIRVTVLQMSSGAFAVTGTSPALPAMLNPGSCMDVMIRFIPVTPGMTTGILSVQGDVPADTFSVIVTGTGAGSVGVGREAGLSGVLSVAPNPMRDRVEIIPGINQTRKIAVRIVNLHGQIVIDYGVVDPAIVRKFVWDGRDPSGRPAASGLYRVIVQEGDRQYTAPLVLGR